MSLPEFTKKLIKEKLSLYCINRFFEQAGILPPPLDQKALLEDQIIVWRIRVFNPTQYGGDK
jgi:hypothetical protein